MLKAKQALLLQQTNLNMVAIRLKELVYFQTFIQFFGNQSVFVAGFLIGAFTNYGDLQKDLITAEAVEVLFIVSLATSFAFAVLCLLCTAFVNIYGISLAIRGPEGSLERAIEGLLIEQEVIFMSSMLAVFFWTISLISTAFVYTTLASSIFNVVFFTFVTLYWCQYCLKLYNRFKITKQRNSFDSDAVNPLHENSRTDCEGYLTKKGIKKSVLQGDPYARRYFVLKKNLLYYYKSQNAFKENPEDAIKSKPINLNYYLLEILSNKETDTYKLTLKPNQEQWDARIWEFICDSEDDIYMWKVAMQATTTGPSASETNIKRTNSFTTIG